MFFNINSLSKASLLDKNCKMLYLTEKAQDKVWKRRGAMHAKQVGVRERKCIYEKAAKA
jgi:hypothetical protein